MSLEIFQDAMEQVESAILTLRNPDIRLVGALQGADVSEAMSELAGRATMCQAMEAMEAALKDLVMHHRQEIDALRQEVASMKIERRALHQMAERLLKLLENRHGT